MRNKENAKLEWNTIVIYIIRLLFVVEFFMPVIIWFVRNTQHTHTEVKFINMFTAILGLSLTFLPKAVELISKRKLPTTLSFAIILFVFSAEFLGELKKFYDIFPWWDVMLHTVSGIILGLIGFMLIFVLNESTQTKVQLSPVFICFFAFCFAVSCGAIWEIFEFCGDRLLHMNMQKYLPPAGVTKLYTANWRFDAGLVDTMSDIICDASSAFFTSFSGFIALTIRAHKLGKKTPVMVSEEELMETLPHGKDFHTKQF
jgi:hypothetical protein